MKSASMQNVFYYVMFALFSLSAAFMLFAATFDESEYGMDSVAGDFMPKPPSRPVGPWRTPAPLNKPHTPAPYRAYVGEAYGLRDCECRNDWETLPADEPGKCRCRGLCPAFVTPAFLTAADGQSLCTLKEATGFSCYAECTSASDTDVKWFAQPCGGDHPKACDTLISAAPEKPPTRPEPAVVEEPKQPSKEEMIDLRGLSCELLDGVERCFYQDFQGREVCPPFVTSTWLQSANGQYMCGSEMSDKYFCTVGCQEGNDEVRWGANEISWCNDNKGSCPKRPPLIKKSEFKLKEWSAPKVVELPCQVAYREGKRGTLVPNLSMGMLTHEPKSMKDSLATYDTLGLFDVAAEFLIYINKRHAAVDEVIAPYLKKYGSKIRVMGDEVNHGIARGMMFLTGNATYEYFLFLERDFQLILPSTCISEQLNAGVKLVAAGTAHVVRYRHKRQPGRPNWAERMFRGHEDDVFGGSQPNLFCNHYYWVDEPEKRWPDKMWICNEDPLMHCTDSFYCNWTNNPQLWKVSWWNKEYVEKFDSFKQNDPYYDLEAYMNWEPHSWNDRKFIVAQGNGLFKHVDRGNFGTA